METNIYESMASNESFEINDVRKHYVLNDRCKAIGEKNIWIEISRLAKKHNAIDLGQGFPDYSSGPCINDKIKETLEQSTCLIHQYTRPQGNQRLVEAIAKMYGLFMEREIDAKSQILVNMGAGNSLYNAIIGLISRGDEVIIIEPFFDSYASICAEAGATCRYVPLRQTDESNLDNTSPLSSQDWSWNDNELAEAFNAKTKIFIVNTPNNPLGKVYTRQELERIAELCIEHNVVCLSDEVYEHITYDRPHIRIATLPGMWHRTLTIGSAGKSFASTGLKLGWTIGPSELLRPCRVVHDNSIFCCPTLFQEVVARCFEEELERYETRDGYFNSISAELRPKRDMLAKQLIEAGLRPIIPEGGFFMMADISQLAKNIHTDSDEWKDSKFVKYLICERGLATLPSTSFYSEHNKTLGQNYIRFCFMKTDSTLEKAAAILKKTLKYF